MRSKPSRMTPTHSIRCLNDPRKWGTEVDQNRLSLLGSKAWLVPSPSLCSRASFPGPRQCTEDGGGSLPFCCNKTSVCLTAVANGSTYIRVGVDPSLEIALYQLSAYFQ